MTHELGDVITVPYCGHSSALSDSSYRSQCLPGGQWSTPPQSCAVNSCDFPPFVEHADVIIDAVTVSYTCHSGYRFTDGTLSRQLACVDGEWRGDADNCSRTFTLFVCVNPTRITHRISRLAVYIYQGFVFFTHSCHVSGASPDCAWRGSVRGRAVGQ